MSVRARLFNDPTALAPIQAEGPVEQLDALVKAILEEVEAIANK